MPSTLIRLDLAKGITSLIDQPVANILQGIELGQSQDPGIPSSPVGVAGCIWYSVSKDLAAPFNGPAGRFNAVARMAVHFGFHDAGTWSQKLASAGQDCGANGSLVLFNEIVRKENRGLEVAVVLAKTLQLNYKAGGVTMADMIQYMAAHAVVT
ncbi:hypothetical protein BJ878DRAFT_555481 [Calycina marina]|uniref:Peroxidase n=1 Tax=Calycina marina TaxID=1763456 RepID=A0A9P7Z9N1_9HELO|nr:hypothetical protein BJ878DRAFT_555481 [Calycina marina]